ncbi:Hypothetical predicted protein [Lecanosticta acicola]|uniref:Uncharacterized protein n=1 Tax=Lecanosticta acicola TaxID=111012 RepID=A0AAI8Z5T8_9PEZI|nr:Hypothetical predicted protein [Lecanosticta acicola]
MSTSLDYTAIKAHNLRSMLKERGIPLKGMRTRESYEYALEQDDLRQQQEREKKKAGGKRVVLSSLPPTAAAVTSRPMVTPTAPGDATSSSSDRGHRHQSESAPVDINSNRRRRYAGASSWTQSSSLPSWMTSKFKGKGHRLGSNAPSNSNNRNLKIFGLVSIIIMLLIMVYFATSAPKHVKPESLQSDDTDEESAGRKQIVICFSPARLQGEDQVRWNDGIRELGWCTPSPGPVPW